jgi:aminoglycoside phosphotransferase (APT) family kinase protein
MSGERMHADELDVEDSLVRRLITDQFPQWGDLTISRVRPDGTVNANFRLGDRLAVRLARLDGPTKPGGKEIEWLPRLRGQLPFEIPVPVAQGRPTAEYPWFWDVVSWVDGETLPVEAIDAIQAAQDLARFISALQRVDPAGAPQGRGVPLASLDDSFRYWRARFDGDRAVSDEWERALAAAAWPGPPVWHHGDLDARNWLVRDRCITGVIDWGAMGIGDPACDLMVAWKLHSTEARDAFKDALPADNATWGRARGWVIWQSVAALAYYTPENNPLLYQEAEHWLSQALSS